MILTDFNWSPNPSRRPILHQARSSTVSHRMAGLEHGIQQPLVLFPLRAVRRSQLYSKFLPKSGPLIASPCSARLPRPRKIKETLFPGTFCVTFFPKIRESALPNSDSFIHIYSKIHSTQVIYVIVVLFSDSHFGLLWISPSGFRDHLFHSFMGTLTIDFHVSVHANGAQILFYGLFPKTKYTELLLPWFLPWKSEYSRPTCGPR